MNAMLAERMAKSIRMLWFLVGILEDNLVFADRILFLEDAVDLVPTKYHPRADDDKEYTNDESEDSRIKKDGYTENETESSEENHNER